ncbi:hypothetical protein DSO57_1003894 [Entomophthora muscae]|uniref:Uncharacterized protein n=1 Tax=Entomophthora muscae TaxID=34485 RepID=A0ACC2SAG5_9FUNG|nr:hypothetical protein DSO57_1003894 [Entomophthora muscae]
MPQDFPDAMLMRYQPKETNWQEFSSLFERLTVVKILRSFGCPQERYDSFVMTQHMECFQKMNVSVLAISEVSLGCKEFVKNGNWGGDLYLDLSQDVCRPTEGSLPFGFLERMLPRPLRRKAPDVRSMFQLGGTYIVTPDFEIMYKHEPESLQDNPSTGLILHMCHNLVARSLTNSTILPYNPNHSAEMITGCWMLYETIPSTIVFSKSSRLKRLKTRSLKVIDSLRSN